MRLLTGRRGQGLVEYVLVVVLMALLVVGAVRFLGTKTREAFDYAGNTLENEMNHAKSENPGP